MAHLSRRDALRMAALAAAVPALPALAPSAAARAAAGSGTGAAGLTIPTPASWTVTPFDNTQVTLASSLFTANRDRVQNFLVQYPIDDMLAVYRANAGLDTRGGRPPGGWETYDSNLRGHYGGHFLSALSLAYAGTGDRNCKARVDYMVGALGECQDALAALAGTPGGPSRAGYLAAYPETQFADLERYATYPDVWAPWYTNHMIMRGLLDAYRHTGNQQALAVAVGMGDWAHSRLSVLSRDRLDRMWRIYIAGEYNAMPVVMTDLYALTGDAKYLATARCFDNTYLLDDAIAGRDTLDGEHANQHIPQYLGYLSIHERTGEATYLTAAENFWDMVVPHRTYLDGGTAGSGEFFGARDEIAGSIQAANAETCCAYNMLKLSRGLFLNTADPKYMQFYERALYGQILASRQNTSSARDPLLTYFVPVDPGARRGYGNLGTCCGGTGLESHAKFQDSVYFSSADGSALYVNLYVPSTLAWSARGLTVTQTTDYPTDPAGTSTLRIGGSARFALRLRVPYWAERGFTVRLNGAVQDVGAPAGGYVTLDRQWADGDTVRVDAPFTLRVERALDDPATQSLAYGPVPLVLHSSSTSYQRLTLYGRYPLSRDLGQVLRPGPAPMTFTTPDGLTFRPFYLDDTDGYHAYWTRYEPTVVFGSTDTGVANRRGADGRTFLDQVWDRGPFAAQASLVGAVDTVSAAFAGAGLLTAQERQTLLDAAAHAVFPA